MLIDGAPEVVLLASDLEKYFIAVPLVTRLCAAMAQLIGELLAKLAAPLSHCFIGHDHAPRGEQLFDVTKAEVEAMVEPDRMSNNFLGNRKPL